MVTVVEKKALYDSMMQKAKRIGEAAEQEAMEAEQNRTISQRVADIIREEKIHRLILPKEFGYPQLDWRTYVDMISTVGYYNLSAAWLTYFFCLHNAWVCYYPKHIRDEVINQGGFVADVFAPVGKVEPVEGGYLISGKYHFVSGINYCDWVGVGAMMKFDDNDKPERVGILLKVKDLKIVKDWDSLGLRGTGSNTIIVDKVFVEPDKILRFSKIIEKSQPPYDDFDEDYLYFNTPFYPGFYVGFAAMALGGAQRVLDEFKKHTVGRVRFSGVKEKESPTSQRVLSELTLEYISAKCLMEEYIKMMEADKGGPYEGAKYKAIRAKIIDKCVNIGTKALLTLGAHAVVKGHPVELFTRDLMTIGTHITSLYEDGIIGYGRHLFGIETNIQG
ncbi:acyl-CoA dehydrogenase family protein [Ureibacillus sp. FSL K6-8385]|uniref:Flavin-dependent monooxygenase n=1 Tax=Ureibacillus terrenus TaxID=118246 RepID=A0A540V208_9BACL|nr:acyl-CoA dehydrogenase family protein [Ureibacillus terrenus]MED3661050.1 acyl-CoA dehydrogenase family protein [Ureibacillus terrenus]MED3763336.1 acyl-CoA dehydrogenase family protein [Ureibacillus terrenus]TQE90751.1 flavin-dependent monooxygenase [Ureibacillus terrenus]